MQDGHTIEEIFIPKIIYSISIIFDSGIRKPEDEQDVLEYDCEEGVPVIPRIDEIISKPIGHLNPTKEELDQNTFQVSSVTHIFRTNKSNNKLLHTITIIAKPAKIDWSDVPDLP